MSSDFVFDREHTDILIDKGVGRYMELESKCGISIAGRRKISFIV